MRASTASSTDSSIPSAAPKGVPRRFGLGMLFVWTTLFSALFVLADALELPWPVAPAASGFLVLIALAQWYFGEGRRARLASMIVGSAIYPSVLLVGMLMGPSSLPVSLAFALSVVIASIFFGAVFGYFAGVLVAGVFLVAYWIDRAFENWRNQGWKGD